MSAPTPSPEDRKALLDDENDVEIEQAIDMSIQEACESLVSQVENINGAEYKLADHRDTVFSEGQA